MSFDRLIDRIKKLNNPTVAGLDPKLSFIPDFIKKTAAQKTSDPLEAAAEAIFMFNCGLIDVLFPIVPAIKPQAAYYEMYGWQGVRALAKTIAYAKSKGMFVITDGKRNDIGTTMEAYADAHIGITKLENGQAAEAFGADALTVNGYLGSDGIRPLIDICKSGNKGIFVLVKTSNPSSGELQDRIIDQMPVYEAMGQMCELWGEGTCGKSGYSAVGAVVGATYPQQLVELRKKLPHTFFLVPGYGAQGADAKDITGAFDENGEGAIINSSRAIMCAWQQGQAYTEKDYAKAAAAEAIRMRNEINAALSKKI